MMISVLTSMLCSGASAQDIWSDNKPTETPKELKEIPASSDADMFGSGDGMEQYLRPVNFWLGPKVGANLAFGSTPDNMPGMDVKTGAGFEVGIVANLRFLRPEDKPLGNERLGAQVEFLYSMQNLGTADKTISMNCFEVPVLVQWYPISSFGVEVGPTFKGAMASSPKDLHYGTTIYNMSKLKAMDVMVTFGILYKHKSGFNVDLRYNLGNSDIAGNFKTKASTLALSFGWLFPLIK